MEVKVRLFGALRDRLPREQRGRATLKIQSDAVVQDVLDMLGLDEAVTVAVNDEHDSDMRLRLNSGDSLLIFEMSAGG